jgi:hypothetical protein
MISMEIHVNLWGVLSEQNVNRFPIHRNSWIVNLWGVLSEQNVNWFPIHGNSWIVNLWGMLSEQNVNWFPIHGNSWIVNLWGNMNNYFDEESQNTNKGLHHSYHTALSGWKLFYIYEHVLMPLIVNWVIDQWIVPIVFASGIPLLPCSYAYCHDLHGNSWIVNLWGVLSEQNVNRFLIHGNSWIVNLWGALSQQNVNRFPIHGNSWIVNLWGMLSQQNVNRFTIHGNSWIVNLWGNMNNYFDEESQNTNKELHHSHHTALSGWKTFLHLWTCTNVVNNKLSYWSMNCAHSLCQWYSIIAVQLRVLPWSPRKFMNR